jgi:broad-specificity NMP kinase
MKMVDTHCHHCAESALYVVLRAAADEYKDEISRDDYPQSRLEEMRKILAALNQKIELIEKPAAPGVH